MTARIVIRSGREKSLRRRHPWIFSGAIDSVDGEPERGATVDVVDARGAFLARAAYSPASQIRARVWSFDPDERIDEAFFRRRLERAIGLRRRLGYVGDDTACRLVFSESDGLPGVIVDAYAGYLVCQFLAAGAERSRETIVAGLLELLRPCGVYERSEGAARRKEGLESRRGLLAGDAPTEIVYRSGRLLRRLALGAGQKTGAYLDQQENLARVARYAAGARVLDAFSYTGAFAATALLHGARSATLLDSSGEALERAAEDARANGLAAGCRYIEGNVFEELRVLREREERFDLVVLDPPKFVHSASQVQAGSRGYKDVNLLALKLVAPGGTLATFSCSGHVDALLFQKILAGAAVDSGRDAQLLERLTQPPDHPVALPFPEAEYLKGFILGVD
jgi:23S rRNA (cytosine1962-C5)-methyltransferase